MKKYSIRGSKTQCWINSTHKKVKLYMLKNNFTGKLEERSGVLFAVYLCKQCADDFSSYTPIPVEEEHICGLVCKCNPKEAVSL